MHVGELHWKRRLGTADTQPRQGDRRVDVRVAEQKLDVAEIDATVKESHTRGVPQRGGCDALRTRP